MKSRVSLFAVGVFLLAFVAFWVGVTAAGTRAAAFLMAGEPVPGVQVSITQDPEGYKAGRPTDNAGAAPFAGLDAGTYIITLKRFTKTASAYKVAINASGGVKSSAVWDAAKKDTFKTTVTLKGEDSQSLNVLITVADEPPAGN